MVQIHKITIFHKKLLKRTITGLVCRQNKEIAMDGVPHRYDLATGTDQALPLAGLREAVALDFDYDRNCLYWADISLDTIQVSGGFGREVTGPTDSKTSNAGLVEERSSHS